MYWGTPMFGNVTALDDLSTHTWQVAPDNEYARIYTSNARAPPVGIWALRAMKGNSDGAGNSDVAGT